MQYVVVSNTKEHTRDVGGFDGSSLYGITTSILFGLFSYSMKKCEASSRDSNTSFWKYNVKLKQSRQFLSMFTKCKRLKQIKVSWVPLGMSFFFNPFSHFTFSKTFSDSSTSRSHAAQPDLTIVRWSSDDLLMVCGISRSVW